MRDFDIVRTLCSLTIYQLHYFDFRSYSYRSRMLRAAAEKKFSVVDVNGILFR